MEKKKMIKFTLAFGLLVGGYSAGSVLTSASNDDNAPIELKESKDVKPLAQNVKVAKSELKANFKAKIKMPKQLPFKVDKVLARVDDMGSKDQTDDLQAYEQFFWGNDGSVISVRVHDFVPKVHYEEEKMPEKSKLKNGADVNYFFNGYAEMIDWVDEETGYQYMVTRYLDKDKKAKVSKVVALEMVNSFDFEQ
ncbi:hypothetical protein [Fictibacillus arsenicus]|uniref:DUF4367 domain-containing protein n=1 Tax=Fictibacillus arsenicus TaxID=255247 RepID=A0A1V3GB73_9BACL|nr:hypothetical protein [Fictibacillus arsenicus]OOE14038.1 hypothetical protein UN64_02155 [Fictibacillus arsenicus]